MYVLKFRDNTTNKTTRKLFDSGDDAHAEMVRQWEDKANDGYLEDLEEERDAETWRCYCEEGDDDFHAVLEHLHDSHGPDYEWWVTKARKFYVDFSLRISECRVIAAEDEDAAKEIADQMLYDRDKGEEYWNGIIESMDNDFENWRKKYCEIEVLEEASDDEDADNEEE